MKVQPFKSISMLSLAFIFVSAIVIVSLAMLMMRWYTTSSINRENPHLSVSVYLGDKNQLLGVYIINTGLTPAVVRRMFVSVRGQRFDSPDTKSWLVAKGIKSKNEGCFKSNWLYPGKTIKSGEALPILTTINTVKCVRAFSRFIDGGDVMIVNEFSSASGSKRYVMRDDLDHHLDVIKP